MIERLKTYALFIETVAIIVLAVVLWGVTKADRSGRILPEDGTISRETFTPPPAMTRLNKSQARDAGLIARDIAKDDNKSVLAGGQIKDDSGTRKIAAVLDTKTGETQLIEKRLFAERMLRFELGLGYGLESGDIAKAAQVRATVGRIGPVYFTGQAEYFFVDRAANPHPWNAMAFVNVRF